MPNRKPEYAWREERAEKADVRIGFGEKAQTVTVGEVGRFVNANFKLRRNMNGNLEVDNRPITEADRARMHIAAIVEFGRVTRHTIESILRNAQEASHLEFEPFPDRGFVKGVKYILLHTYRNIGLHKCDDGIYRVRTFKNGFIGSTDCGTDLDEALERYNSIIKLFGYSEQFSIYNFNL